MRRALLALGISIVAHVCAIGIPIAVGLWQAWSLMPTVKMQPVSVDLVKDLPLGAPARKAPEPAPEPPVPVRKSRPKSTTHGDGVKVAVIRDASPADESRDAGAIAPKPVVRDAGALDGGRRTPGDLRRSGPEGSRLIALMRLDRIRSSPGSDKTLAAVDQLLLLLPDRHQLIDGTGLDLFRDFDTLLVATPDPRDAAVTFLAARHHLTDPAFKAALDKGAKATKRSIAWRTIDGRPVGIRQQAKGAALDRDDRLLVLPQASLALMATPAYAVQLLGSDPRATAKPTAAVDAGLFDGGAAGNPSPRARVQWSDIVARIEDEENAIPDDAAFMMTATRLFGAGPAAYVVPPNRGASDDQPLQPLGSAGGPVPESITLIVGIAAPFIDVAAEFASSKEADVWERDVPSWKRRLLVNPLVLLSGFSPLLRRAELSRDGDTLRLHAETSTDEIQRLLYLIVNLTKTGLTYPQP
jgi:hypothetical protein